MPPTGWNSRNTFTNKTNDALILSTADIMMKSGFLAAGYNYLVWSLKQWDSRGHLVSNLDMIPV